jgi:hypothetical protein
MLCLQKQSILRGFPNTHHDTFVSTKNEQKKQNFATIFTLRVKPKKSCDDTAKAVLKAARAVEAVEDIEAVGAAKLRLETLAPFYKVRRKIGKNLNEFRHVGKKLFFLQENAKKQSATITKSCERISSSNVFDGPQNSHKSNNSRKTFLSGHLEEKRSQRALLLPRMEASQSEKENWRKNPLKNCVFFFHQV